MQLSGFRHQMVEFFPVQLKDLRVYAARQIADIAALGGHGNVFRSKNGLQRGEKVLVTPLVTIHFRKAQLGGHVAAVQRKRLCKALLGQGIREFRQIVVAQQGKHRRQRVLFAELFQRFRAFVGPPHGGVNIVPGGHQLFRRALRMLYVFQCGERLLELIGTQIDIQQFIDHLAVAGEILHQSFVEGGSLLRTSFHQVHARERTAVPEIVPVQRHGLFQ